jgi:hypothetical protein
MGAESEYRILLHYTVVPATIPANPQHIPQKITDKKHIDGKNQRYH